MRRAGAPSWQIRTGIDQQLTMALYVRDVAGLGSQLLEEPNVPPLQPGVRPRETAVDLDAAMVQWQQWWARSLQQPDEQVPPPHPPDFESLQGFPAVRALLAQHYWDYNAWMKPVHRAEMERARQGGLNLTRFVNAYERTLRRRVNPFTLLMREVPVRGVDGWVLGPDSVVISTGLHDNPAALEAFLRPVIDALA